jgi:hypothetical protein
MFFLSGWGDEANPLFIGFQDWGDMSFGSSQLLTRELLQKTTVCIFWEAQILNDQEVIRGRWSLIFCTATCDVTLVTLF